MIIAMATSSKIKIEKGYNTVVKTLPVFMIPSANPFRPNATPAIARDTLKGVMMVARAARYNPDGRKINVLNISKSKVVVEGMGYHLTT